MKQAKSIPILILWGALLITGCNVTPENSLTPPDNSTETTGADATGSGAGEDLPLRYLPAVNEPVPDFGEGPTAIMRGKTGADDIYKDVYEYDLEQSKLNNPDLNTGLGAVFGTEEKAKPSDYNRLQQKLVGTLAEDIQKQQSQSRPTGGNFDPTNAVANPAPQPIGNTGFLFYGKAQQTADPTGLIGNGDMVTEQLELERQVRERVNQRTSPRR